MPGGDRRGPSGNGPMTGRGMGFCAGYDRGGYDSNYQGRGLGRGGGGFGRGGAGFGRGSAGGFGSGRGFRNRFFNAAPAAPYGGVDYRGTNELTPDREMDLLRSEAKAIEGELGFIQSRIKELENISLGKDRD